MQQTIIQQPSPNVTVVRSAQGGGAGERIVVVPPPAVAGNRQPGINPMGIVNAGVALAVLFPLSVALAIRLVQRGQRRIAALPSDVAERLSRIEQAIESSAIEVERIGEGQRYLTRVLSSTTREPVGPPGA